MVRHSIAVLLAAASAAAPARLAAQDTAPAPAAAPQRQDSATRRNLIAINPLLILFNGVAVEYEHAGSPGTSLGTGVSYYDFEGDQYLSVDAKLRFYPDAGRLHGFSFGLSAGVVRTMTAYDCPYGPGVDCTDDRVTVPTFGVLLEYGWLLGEQHRFHVGLGVGAKRLLASEDKGLPPALPTARLTIGRSF